MDSSVLSDDSDYDIVSPDASIADLRHGLAAGTIYEPPPSQAACEAFGTCQLPPEEIQAFVQSSLGLSLPSQARPKRVYVDGIFDGLNVRDALLLRQVKLSFPCVYLVVGVFSSGTCDRFGTAPVLPEIERYEVVRHCRWVDEVLPDAPCTLDPTFLVHHKIDYVAIEEGATVDPSYHKLRLKGYDELKKNGMVILTQRTTGVVSSLPRTPVPVEPEALAPDFTAHVDIYGIGY